MNFLCIFVNLDMYYVLFVIFPKKLNKKYMHERQAEYLAPSGRGLFRGLIVLQ